jgi:hypothetical protein
MVEDCIYPDEIAVFSHTEFGRLHIPNRLHDSDTVTLPRDLAEALVEVCEYQRDDSIRCQPVADL